MPTDSGRTSASQSGSTCVMETVSVSPKKLCSRTPGKARRSRRMVSGGMGDPEYAISRRLLMSNFTRSFIVVMKWKSVGTPRKVVTRWRSTSETSSRTFG